MVHFSMLPGKEVILHVANSMHYFDLETLQQVRRAGEFANLPNGVYQLEYTICYWMLVVEKYQGEGWVVSRGLVEYYQSSISNSNTVLWSFEKRQFDFWHKIYNQLFEVAIEA